MSLRAGRGKGEREATVIRTMKESVRIAAWMPTFMRACAATVTNSRSTSEGRGLSCNADRVRNLRIKYLRFRLTAPLAGGTEAPDLAALACRSACPTRP